MPQRSGGFFHLHLVSDATGETLITVARAAAAQYASVAPIEHIYPLVRTEKQLDRVISEIEAAPGIVLYTMLDSALAERLQAKCREFSIPCMSFLDYELILFRDVDLPPATQVAFAKSFGEVQIHVMNQYQKYPEYPEIYMLTNADKDGKPTGKHPDKGTLHWHTDGSWRERTGQATMMYSEIVPPAGGETEFADMYTAYDNLPAAMKKKIEGKRAIHNLDFSRTRRHGEDPMTAEQKAKVPPIAHPIVRTHPETGRKAIFLGDHAQEIEGMDYEEGRALIEELNVLITPQDRVYTHHWSPRECMVWDNRCTLHRATGFDEANHVRVMRRCTINGDRPY